jgi:HK97 family phage prohead protease
MHPMRRAYSTIQVKDLSEDAREFVGIASTPTVDRVGDIVEPGGAKYTLPIPLLWQHDKNMPIGEIMDARVSKSGIQVKARVFKASQSRTLMDRLDEAWESIKLGLVKGLSIGFLPSEYEPMKETGGYRITKWDWHELSAVTIPANMDASISSIKSADRELLTALGQREGVVVLDEQYRRACRKSDVFYLTE